jgi:hypothetical protein
MTNKLQVEYLIAYDGNSGTRVQITLSLLETSGWNAHDLLPHIDEQDLDYCYRSLVIHLAALRQYTYRLLQTIPTPSQTRLVWRLKC